MENRGHADKPVQDMSQRHSYEYTPKRKNIIKADGSGRPFLRFIPMNSSLYGARPRKFGENSSALP